MDTKRRKPVPTVTSFYRCPACGQVIIREGTKAWRKSYCESRDRYARLQRLNQSPTNL